MKKILLTFLILNTSLISFGQNNVNWSDCNSLRGENESYGSDGSSSWCNMSPNTAYVNCMCSKEREHQANLDKLSALKERYYTLRTRNENLYKKASAIFMSGREIEQNLNSAQQSYNESSFYAIKSEAIGYFKQAINTKNQIQSSYNLCMEIKTLSPAHSCESVKKKYKDNSFESHLRRLEDHKFVKAPDEITLSNTGSSSQNEASNIEGTNGNDIKNEQKTVETNQSTSPYLQQLNSEKNSLYSEASKIKDDPNLTVEEKKELILYYTALKVKNNRKGYEESQRVKLENQSKGIGEPVEMGSFVIPGNDNNYLNNDEVKALEDNFNYQKTEPKVYEVYLQSEQFQQDVAQLSTALFEAFKVDPEKQRERQAFRYEMYRINSANRESTLKEELMSDFSSNGLAVKKNSKGWYGFVDKDDNWIIKPKYLDAQPFYNGKALITTKIGYDFYIDINGKKL